MPATLNVNNMTVVHSGSSGIAMSFPDVCKTPTPGGPIPIPYPNIAQSSDTADGSSTVKVDGNPIMLKSSNFRMSSGDEAGSAMGVVSNKIKGKATPANASFDVKVDGTSVFRLSDPMQTNGGSACNALNAAIAQPPLVTMAGMSDECKKMNAKERQSDEIASKNCGMDPDHFKEIKAIAGELNVIFYFRQTDGLCLPWIKAKHQPKPHRVFLANTIVAGDREIETQAWLDRYKAAYDEGPLAVAAFLANPSTRGDRRVVSTTTHEAIRQMTSAAVGISDAAVPIASNAAYSTKAKLFLGVIGEPVAPGLRKPLQAEGVGPQPAGISYKGKWITGDYDLFEILQNKPDCQQVPQGDVSFATIRKTVNSRCKWDAIQHGPQTQWVPSEHEKKKGAPDVNFPAAVGAALAARNPSAVIPIEGRKPMNVIDKQVTVIAPAGSIFLDTQQDTLDALICSECGGGES